MNPCSHCGQPLGQQNIQTPHGWMHQHCASVAFPSLAVPPKKKTSIALVALAVIGGLFVVGTIANATKGKGPGGAAADTKVEAVAVTAKKLCDDYKANEVAADAAYRDKWLDVTATVDSIEKTAFDDIVVRLDGPNSFEAPRAYSEDAAGAAKLVKGQKITARCKGGGMTLGSPVLRKCTF